MRQIGRMSQRAQAAMRLQRSRVGHLAKPVGIVAVVAGLLVGLSMALSGTVMERLGLYLEHEITRHERETGLVLRNVLARGLVRTDQARISAMLDPFLDQPMRKLDIAAMRRSIEALPWVREATVARRYPDSLLVELVEREPMALWHDGTKVVLIDREGAPLEIGDLQPYRDLPLLAGAQAPEHAKEFFEIAKGLGTLASRVTAAANVDGRRWNLYIDGRIELRLPAAHPQRALARVLAADARDGLFERAIEVIDARHEGRMVLRLMQGAIDAQGRGV